ncbi:MBL fold metallo-hydrolase [Salipaludibacillus sp. CUR1]|uniref:MBL fold metallo-hydrolase n=1 Tax=Salipaludibacillus sp. CUR1 TaxID=2820003 RepID=UPI001E2CB8B9|nr:MBL fold metallo-hydrolase [Salipaludibacillus sp. CUR1]MCE7792404.1 MBL fold metallo-hydrolase [Salipaludibacillus sp. CUR1]
MVKLSFLGGAGEYGRSCFLIECGKNTLMVDCGIMKNARNFNDIYPRLDRKTAERVSHVFVTHSHEDHTLALPYLVSLGFSGDVLATASSIDETKEYFKEWRNKAEDKGSNLLYTLTDESKVNFKAVDEQKTNEWIELNNEVSFKYGRSGHTSGSVWYAFKISGKTLFFSGDYSMESTLFNYQYPELTEAPELAVMDAAYGDYNSRQEHLIEEIMNELKEALKRKKRVCFQVPLAGKSQELLAAVCKRIELNEGSFIYMENKLKQASKKLGDRPEWLTERSAASLFKKIGEADSPIAETESPADVPPGSIGFFTAERLEEKDAWAADGHTHLVTAGPENETVKKKALEYGTYCKLPFNVHPTKDETAALLSYLKPAKTIFTHGEHEDVNRLIQTLEKGNTHYLNIKSGESVTITKSWGV